MSENEPLLSGEEADALLDAMRAEQPAVAVDEVDLTAPDRALRECLGHADRAADRFGIDASKPFLKTLGCSVNIESEPAEIVPFDLLKSGLEPGTAVATLRTKTGLHGYIALGPALVNAVLDRRLGAPVQSPDSDGPTPPPAEFLSNVDQRVLRPFIETLTGVFRERWTNKDGPLEIDSVLSQASEIPDRNRSEPMLRISWRVVPASAPSDRILVALAANAVTDTVEKEEPESPEPSTRDRLAMVRRIRTTAVEVAAILGRRSARIRDVVSWDTGDVIRLDRVAGAPIDLEVGSKTVLVGTPAIQHGNLAVQITEGS
ncbi:MAG: FliM/FliN family flagellar motor switch protein [Myxococcota bacterium]